MKLSPSRAASAYWRWVIPLVLLQLCWSARADNIPPNITAGEKALLPEYCADTQTFGYGDAYSNTSPRAAYWVGLMGKTFWAMHHQCWAMIREHRSRAAGLSRQDRDAHLNGAINDYVYVVENAPPDFVLLPEIYTQIGENHVLLGNIGAALDAFTAARRKKVDYWPPYTAWARVLLKSGKRQEALAHVESVMKLVPGDAELKRQYNLLKNAPSGPNRSTSKTSPRAGSVAAPSARPAASGPGGTAAVAVSSSSKPNAASAVSR